MASKPVSGNELNWIIFQEFEKQIGIPRRLNVAVVRAAQGRWHIVIGKNSRRYVDPAAAKRIAVIERKLQAKYVLAQ